MDRRQAKKVAYLAMGDVIGDVLAGNEVELDDILEQYGVTDPNDISRVRRAFGGIQISLVDRGNAMSATGGGGTRFTLPNLPGVQTVTQPQNQITVPQPTSFVPNTSGGLLPVSDDQLEDLVKGEIDNRVKNLESFTAYDITVAIRVANPTLNIRHQFGAREIVHDIMLGIPNYTSQGKVVSPNGAVALEFMPVATPVAQAPALSGGGLTSHLLTSSN